MQRTVIRTTAASHTCSIQVAADAVPLLERLVRAHRHPIVVVTDAPVRRHVWAGWTRRSKTLRQLGAPIVVQGSESHKNVAAWTTLQRAFLSRGLDRHSLVVAVGGGMVTDLAGFAAATWMRGIPWVAVPTTLLGMVDAAIGGKVALNLGRTKNVVGNFHQPDAVLIGTRTLRTLPARQRRSGLAEVVKYAMIADAPFFRELESAGTRLLQAHDSRDPRVVARCARHKARVVNADTREAGQRAMLNFGHTVGHVLEAQSRDALAHGEAVGLGMLVACRIAELQGRSGDTPRQRLQAVLQSWKLPVRLRSRMTWPRLWRGLQADKKTLHGAPRFVLTPRIGRVEIGQTVAPELIREAVEVVAPRR